MVEVDDAPVDPGDLLDRLPVQLEALLEVGDLAGLVQQAVDRLVAEVAHVEAALAGLELVDVAVGIEPAAPADLGGLERPGVLLLEERGELDRAQRDVEPRLPGHPLHHLAQSPLLGVVHDHQLEGVAAGEAGVREQLLGPRHVAGGALPALVVEGADRAERRAAGRVLSLPHHLVEGVPVDRQVQRLPHAGVVGERGAEVARRVLLAGLVPEVDGDAGVGEPGHARDLEPALLPEAHRVARRHQVRHVDVTRAQVRDPDVVVRDDPEHQPVEVDRLGVVVVGRALQDDPVLGHALHELPGAHAHRRRPELLVELPGLGRGDRHPGPVGEGGDQRRERSLEPQPHRQGIDDVHLGHRRQLAAPVAALHLPVAVQRVLHRLGGHRRAVVELDARAELDGDGLPAVGEAGQVGRQLRVDGQALVDVVELLAHVGVHDAAHVALGERGVQDVGILVQRHHERLLGGLRAGRDHEPGQRRQSREGQGQHERRSAPPDHRHTSMARRQYLIRPNSRWASGPYSRATRCQWATATS